MYRREYLYRPALTPAQTGGGMAERDERCIDSDAFISNLVFHFSRVQLYF